MNDMNEQYLAFRSAGGEWLLSMDHVVEVGFAPGIGGAASFPWRERVLAVKSMQEYVNGGRLGNETHFVVVREQDETTLLTVEAITGLLQVAPDDLVPLIPTCARTAQCVDAALLRPDGRCALRLRWPQTA